MKKLQRDESGAMTIVEATIVFPVMLIVIFFLIYIGNTYYQKCRFDGVINSLAIEGAAYCADPMIDDISSGSIPAVNELDVQPYRYLIGGMNDIESYIKGKVQTAFDDFGTGFFLGMEPVDPKIDVKFHNYFICSSFSIEISYKITVPIRLIGQSEPISTKISSYVEVPVSDTPEFVRNVNMVEDILEKTGAMDKIKEAIEKAKEWFS